MMAQRRINIRKIQLARYLLSIKGKSSEQTESSLQQFRPISGRYEIIVVPIHITVNAWSALFRVTIALYLEGLKIQMYLSNAVKSKLPRDAVKDNVTPPSLNKKTEGVPAPWKT